MEFEVSHLDRAAELDFRCFSESLIMDYEVYGVRKSVESHIEFGRELRSIRNPITD